jgi:hypothetical protein
MKPIILATSPLVVIFAASMGFSAQPPSQREYPLVCVDDLAIPLENRRGFDLTLIPDHVRKLEGQRVRIIGTMVPSFQAKGIREFVLNGGTRGRGYSSNPIKKVPVQYYIPVAMRMGETAEYSLRFVEVTGQLKIRPEITDDGMLIWLYHLKDASVSRAASPHGLSMSIHLGC